MQLIHYIKGHPIKLFEVYLMIIAFILWNIMDFLVAMMFTMTLKPRYPRIPGWVIALIYAVLLMPPGFVKILNFDDNFLFQCMYYVDLLATVALVFIPFKDKWWKKLLLFVLFTILTYVSEDTATYILVRMGYVFTADYREPQNFIYLGVTGIFNLLGIFLITVLWNAFMNRVYLFQKMWIFLLFPISQLALISSIRGVSREMNLTTVKVGMTGMIGIAAGFVADMVLLYILVEQDRALRIRQHLQELHNKQVLEEAHYKEIETERIELAKIRHDYNNQLCVISHLCDEENNLKAEELLQELIKQLKKEG